MVKAGQTVTMSDHNAQSYKLTSENVTILVASIIYYPGHQT